MWAFLTLITVIVICLLSSLAEKHGAVITLILALTLAFWKICAQQNHIETITEERNLRFAAAERERTAYLELKRQRETVKCDRIHFEGNLEKDAYDQHCDLKEKCKLLETYRQESRQNNVTIVRLSKEIAALEENEQKLAAEAMSGFWQQKRAAEKGDRWQIAYGKVNAQLATARDEYRGLIEAHEWTDLQLQKHEKAYALLREQHGTLEAKCKEVEAKYEKLTVDFNEANNRLKWYQTGYTKKNSNCPPANLVFEKTEKSKRRAEDQKTKQSTPAPPGPVDTCASQTKTEAQTDQQEPPKAQS